MTLLIAFTAAVVVTVVWYSSPKARKMNIGLMCYMYWGASLMWLVDAIFEYSELGADFFAPAASDMLNDLYLGLCAVILGLIVWIAVLLAKDPDNVVKTALNNTKRR